MISYEDRCKLMGQKGFVVWFTGLSGSGKSTIAVAVERLLYEQNIKTCLLDGDNLRLGINQDLGFSDADRNENIRRVSEIAKLFCDSGFVTLVSVISPFSAMREKAKLLIGEQRFLLVYVKAQISTCMERDPKGLYKKNIGQFTGIDSAYQPPENPDIILDTEKLSIDEEARLIIKILGEQIQRLN